MPMMWGEFAIIELCRRLVELHTRIDDMYTQQLYYLKS